MQEFKEIGIVASKFFDAIHHAWTIDALRCSRHNPDFYLIQGPEWEKAYAKSPKFCNLLQKLSELGTGLSIKSADLWAGLKPGDYRFCMHKEDREKLIRNASDIIKCGAKGIYLLAQETHPGSKVEQKDGHAHAELIYDLSCAIGNAFKGICGEEYTGDLKRDDYWNPILKTLPKTATIAWSIKENTDENKDQSLLPDINHPLLFWDRYLADRSIKQQKEKNKQAESTRNGIYEGRNADLTKKASSIAIEISRDFPRQIPSIHSALEFYANPNQYDPKKAYIQGSHEMAKILWQFMLGKREADADLCKDFWKTEEKYFSK